MLKYTRHVGGLWEEKYVKLYKNYELDTTYDSKDKAPCKHAHSYKFENEEHTWIIPNVIIAKNEGGCNCTGVCLDCMKEIP